MKHLMNLIIVLSLFAQAGYAQKIKTLREYEAINDSIASLIKLVEKDSISYVGKPFSEFVKELDKRGLKIMQISISSHDNSVYPQHVYGVALEFLTQEEENFQWNNNMGGSYMKVYFAESKPYEKALDLSRQYKGLLSEEVAAFYGDAVVQRLYFYCPDDVYRMRKHLKMPIDKDKIIR